MRSEDEFVASIPDGWPKTIKDILPDQPYNLMQLAIAHRKPYNYVRHHTVTRKRLAQNNPSITFIPHWKPEGLREIFVWGRDYLKFFGFDNDKTSN